MQHCSKLGVQYYLTTFVNLIIENENGSKKIGFGYCNSCF